MFNTGTEDCNDGAPRRSSSKICPGGAEEQFAMKAKKCRGVNMDDDSRSSVERSRRVAVDKEGHMNKSLGNGVDKLTVVAMDKGLGLVVRNYEGWIRALTRMLRR